MNNNQSQQELTKTPYYHYDSFVSALWAVLNQRIERSSKYPDEYSPPSQNAQFAEVFFYEYLDKRGHVQLEAAISFHTKRPNFSRSNKRNFDFPAGLFVLCKGKQDLEEQTPKYWILSAWHEPIVRTPEDYCGVVANA